MAHKTLINGTAYSVSGGKTLVDGTAYSIKNGKTLVGGTAYEVGFSTDPMITITGGSSIDATYAKLTINGQVYDGSVQHELVLPVGTKIECYVYTASYTPGNVWVNGAVVLQTSGVKTSATYEYIVSTNATICVEKALILGSQGKITITEE